MSFQATTATTCMSDHCQHGGRIAVGDEVVFKYDPYTVTEELFHVDCPVNPAD